MWRGIQSTALLKNIQMCVTYSHHACLVGIWQWLIATSGRILKYTSCLKSLTASYLITSQFWSGFHFCKHSYDFAYFGPVVQSMIVLLNNSWAFHTPTLADGGYYFPLPVFLSRCDSWLFIYFSFLNWRIHGQIQHCQLLPKIPYREKLENWITSSWYISIVSLEFNQELRQAASIMTVLLLRFSKNILKVQHHSLKKIVTILISVLRTLLTSAVT